MSEIEVCEGEGQAGGPAARVAGRPFVLRAPAKLLLADADSESVQQPELAKKAGKTLTPIQPEPFMQMGELAAITVYSYA